MGVTTERLLDTENGRIGYGGAADNQFMEYDTTDAAAGDSSSSSHAEDIAGTTASITVGMAWALLFVAILLEVAGTTAMKLSEGFTHPLPSILVYVFYAASFTVFPFALMSIELSTAYAVWSGLGTTITVIIGFWYFHDTVNVTKLSALAAIVLGCVVLNFADGGHVEPREEPAARERE